MKLPSRAQPVVFGFLLSGLMSLITTGIATVHAIGTPPQVWGVWLVSWLAAWAVAFPTVLFVAPFARRLTSLIVAPPVR